MYRDGNGLPQDNVEAYIWFSLAATDYYPAMSDRDGIRLLLSPAELDASRQEFIRRFVSFISPATAQDSAELKQYRQAAEQGDADAQYQLGVMYQIGRYGTPWDSAEATRWFHLAAGQGHVGAQSQLGLIYERGTSLPWDGAEAVYWYQLAAEQGSSRAQFHIGNLYDRGWRDTVPQDVAEAARWWRLAAEHDYSATVYRFGPVCHIDRELSEDDAERMRLTTEPGYSANAAYSLGLKYHTGRGVPKDFTEAARWYLLSTKYGFSQRALSNLGEMYEYGQWVPQEDDANNQYVLSLMYRAGSGAPKNDTEAARWLRLAADQGLAIAQYDLGWKYYTNDSEMPRDNAEAYVAYIWTSLAIASGCVRAITIRDYIGSRLSSADLAAAQQEVAHRLEIMRPR